MAVQAEYPRIFLILTWKLGFIGIIYIPATFVKILRDSSMAFLFSKAE
jgi:hypothetical protein